MRSTLHLNLHRRFFADIAAGIKRIEKRDRTPYWKKQLEGRNYDAIQFRNGYSTEAPEMLVEFRGLRKRRGEYQILLGRVLQIKRWKVPKPSKAQLARARAYIDSMDWQFAEPMPQWPHWYIIRNRRNARAFDFIDRLIYDFGYADTWDDRTNWYFVIEKFKYWIDENVLNRAAPISNAEFRRRGVRYAARHGKRIGPWGQLISVRKRKR